MNALIERAILLRDAYPTLSKTMQRVHRYIFENPFEVCYLSLKDLASNVQASEVTVLALCRRLGFKNFNDFRDFFREIVSYTLKNNFFDLNQVTLSATMSEDEDVLRKFIWLQYENYTKTVLNTNFDTIREAARKLHTSDQVYVMGHDVSKITADYFAHRLKLLSINAWSIQLGEDESVSAILNNLDEFDTAVIISMNPYFTPTKHIVEYIELRGSSIVVITDSLNSPAIVGKSMVLLCQTKAPLIFNTMSAVMALMELLTGMVAVEMGDSYERIIKEFLEINTLLVPNSNLGGSL